MNLSNIQLLAFKTSMDNNLSQIQTGAGPVAIKDVKTMGNKDDLAPQIADEYNKLDSSNYWVFKSLLAKYELIELTGVADDGATPTAFAIGGATGGYINRAQGERDAFDRTMFSNNMTCRPYLANIRTAIDDVFNGNGAGAVANRNHFRAVARRLATIFEKLYVTAATGGYTSPVASGARGTRTNPDILGLDKDGLPIEGKITTAIVQAAWAAQ